MIKETVPQGPTGYLLHKTTLPRMGDIEDLPNTNKDTWKVSQNEETKKYDLNKITGESFRKITK